MSSSTSGWMEAMIFSVLFIAVSAVVIAGYNVQYSKSYDIGINTSGIEEDIKDYQQTSQNQIEQGQTIQTASESGFSINTAIGIVKGGVTLLWSFVSGGWIETSIGYLHLGEAGTKLAFYLRMFYFIGLIFALLYTIFKVVT